MPLRNRVRPDGEIVATAARGTVYGNRGGCFHRDDGTQKDRPWASIHWIACVLEFKSRRRTIRQPGRYTELFFLDEATALSAGHRPCFECRRADALRFQSCWASAHGLGEPPKVMVMDTVLQSQRVAPPHRKRSIPALVQDLPDGAMVRSEREMALVQGGRLMRWSFEGYGRPLTSQTPVELLTPPAIVNVIRAGYRPVVHATAIARA